MRCTLIRFTNGQREIQHGEQDLAKTSNIETYTYVDVPESKVKEIRDAKYEEVQAILKTIY